MRKKSYCILLFLLLLPLFLILGEFVYFLKQTRSNPELQKADLIVVFTGEAGRVEEGFRLADKEDSAHLMVSRISSNDLAQCRKRLQTSKSVECIAESKARTTFENAIYTKRIMAEKGMRSAVLVTSWDHMPRAHLLLALLSSGSDIRIQCDMVPTGEINAANWYRFPEGWKRMYNEMVQVWGSLYEFAAYRIRGSLPEGAPNRSQPVALLRRMLLFHIKRVHS